MRDAAHTLVLQLYSRSSYTKVCSGFYVQVFLPTFQVETIETIKIVSD